MAVSSNSPMLSFLKRYSEIMFTCDPKSAKVSKGFESPNLQDRVNSPGIVVEDTVFKTLGVTKIVLLGFESVPLTSRFVGTRGCIFNKEQDERLFQALNLILELDEAAVGCTQDILRQRDFLNWLREIP
ncbi:hypothetical protein Tco_0720836 [Tanacetum coccineum]